MKVLLVFLLSMLVVPRSVTAQRSARDGAIPVGLKDKKHVLLVQKQETGLANLQNRKVDKILRKYYTGRYEMASAAEINTNPKYADVTVYRYVLTKNNSGLNIQNPSSDKLSDIQYRDQIIYDRMEKKELPATGLAGHNFAQGVQLFVRAVERYRPG